MTISGALAITQLRLLVDEHDRLAVRLRVPTLMLDLPGVRVSPREIELLSRLIALKVTGSATGLADTSWSVIEYEPCTSLIETRARVCFEILDPSAQTAAVAEIDLSPVLTEEALPESSSIVGEDQRR